jgi:hypothetical protein
MLNEPGLSWSAGTANVLRTSELSTHSSLLGTGHTVDDTCSITGDGALDGVGLHCEVAGVPGTVTGVGAHTAVSSLAALLKSLKSSFFYIVELNCKRKIWEMVKTNKKKKTCWGGYPL